MMPLFFIQITWVVLTFGSMLGIFVSTLNLIFDADTAGKRAAWFFGGIIGGIWFVYWLFSIVHYIRG